MPFTMRFGQPTYISGVETVTTDGRESARISFIDGREILLRGQYAQVRSRGGNDRFDIFMTSGR